MDAKEFRTGNLLNYRTAEGDIITTPLDWQDFKWIEEAPTGFELIHFPIPITEDWLLKYGFEKKEGRHGEYFMHKITELFRVWKTPDNSWGAGRKDEQSEGREYNTYWIVLNYQHVHQLQNLYFALTGLELNANL